MNTIADQSPDSTIQTVWKIVYLILALLFLGFGLIALIGGFQWWGVIFIINGGLFINSSISLNGKSKKILSREIVYLFFAFFFALTGLLFVIGAKNWWGTLGGTICYCIMTTFSILSVSLKEERKANPVIEKIYRKINLSSFVNETTHSDSSESDTFSPKSQNTKLKVTNEHTKNEPAKNHYTANIVDTTYRNPLIYFVIGGLIVGILILTTQNSANTFNIVFQNPLVSTIIGGLIVGIIMLKIEKKIK